MVSGIFSLVGLSETWSGLKGDLQRREVRYSQSNVPSFDTVSERSEQVIKICFVTVLVLLTG